MIEDGQRLFEKAERNLKVAKFNLSAGDPDFIEDICYNSQQAVEKYLKSYLAYNNKEIRHTHVIKDLLNDCKEIDPDFNYLEKFNPDILTDYAVDLRYEEIPVPTIEDAKEATTIAEQVRPFVLGKIKDISLDKSPENQPDKNGPDPDIDF